MLISGPPDIVGEMEDHHTCEDHPNDVVGKIEGKPPEQQIPRYTVVEEIQMKETEDRSDDPEYSSMLSMRHALQLRPVDFSIGWCCANSGTSDSVFSGSAVPEIRPGRERGGGQYKDENARVKVRIRRSGHDGSGIRCQRK